ncbi:MAG: metallophosphoesterase [Bacteroidia bacterium]|nr:metallophosphoesterase [Bacteroidia bacterium]
MIWIGLVWLQQIFAVGDAGALSSRQVRLYQRFWTKHAQPGDILIWLGDNLYPAGHQNRVRDRRRWERLLAVSRSFPGIVVATPGNHDWKAGLSGLRRQAKDIRHLPDPDSSQVETLIVGRYRFLFIDSERYIRNGGQGFDWQRVDALISQIPASSFFFFVLHHPPRTAGAHGGYFPFSAHLFPLRLLHPFLYLPLPVVGTALIAVRKAVRHPTDQRYPTYASLADSLLGRAHRLAQPVLFLSGHDHNLQIHRLSENKYAIVSGSGCKTEPLTPKKALWGKAVVGLWKLSPHSLEAYALRQPDKPIWKFPDFAVP